MITLKVNGAPRQYDGDPDMPLLWYLRDEIQLTGTKFGCGAGTVRSLHGSPQRRSGAQLPDNVKSAAGKDVLTIEGLNAKADHPLQVCWQQCNVPQCGYCQSGQIMQAAALLKQKPKPTDADIDTAMRGNICRCGTYQRIRQAIKQAAEVKK